MGRFSFFITFLICCSLSSTIYANVLFNKHQTIKQINYDNGLPGNNLRHQIQDHLGIMWISVEAMGVCSYDGQKFTHFKNDLTDSTSISSNFVNRIVEDKNGNLWFASDNGLSKYSREALHFKQFLPSKAKNSLPHETCNTLYLDPDGTLWIGTNNGLAKLNADQQSFTNYLQAEPGNASIIGHNINAIEESPRGIFWLGTKDGLIQFNEERGIINEWKNNGQSTNEPIYNRINSLSIDYKNRLWIGTHRGLDCFDIENERFIHWNFKSEDQPFYEREGVNHFLIHNDKIWTSTYTGGILIIDAKTLDYYKFGISENAPNILPGGHIRYTFIDRENNTWIGTKFHGLIQINQSINQFSNWPQRLELLKKIKDIYIYSIFEEDENTIWIGSKLDGLYKADLIKDTIENFRHNPKSQKTLASDRVQSIMRDSEQRLWVGTQLSLELFNERKKEFEKFSKNAINVIFEDSQNQIWVGTSTGLYLIDIEGKNLMLHQDSKYPELFNNQTLDIYSIIEDRDKNLWLSTRDNGLFVYNLKTKNLQHFLTDPTPHKSINSNMVRSLFEDSNGDIWIGTKAGALNFYSIKDNKFSYYGIEHGVPSELVLSITEDEHNTIWIGTHNGIASFDRETQKFSAFNADMGLTSNIAEPGAVASFTHGELLFGGNNGFNVFFPAEIKPVDKKPQVLITAMSVFGNKMLQDVEKSASIELSHNQNYINFDFVLLDYKNPYRHEYAYILENFDPEWIEAGNRNFISYNGLPPGKYTFKVKAANEYGNWSEEIPQITIIIKPPFYQETWFKALMIIAILIIVVTAYMRNRQLIVKRQHELEALVDERTANLKEAIDQLSLKNEVISNQKKEIEKHHSELEHKVIERTKDLEIAKQKAEEADRLKSSFLANMSHEIRTPLNAICGFSSLLNDDDIDKETRQGFIDMIESNSTMLLKLIEDILDLSKIEAQQLTINKEPFDVFKMTTDILAIFSEEIKNQKIEEVELKCPALNKNQFEMLLDSDQYRIKQVMLNLLNNALKFCRKGYIEFGFQNHDQHILFYVKDTGIGIPPAYQEMIFNRFIKIEDKKVMYRGTGLGLSISQSIVNLLGGRIWVESIEGKGSTFTFKIPKTSVSEPKNR